MHATARQRERVVPPTPITVTIEDHVTGRRLCYGVIADVSETGACVWTNGELSAGSHLQFQVSLCQPIDGQKIMGRVVWGSQDGAGSGLRRFGVEWQESASPCVHRIREFARSSFDDSLTPAGGLRQLTRAELER